MKKWTFSALAGGIVLVSVLGTAQASTWLNNQIISGQQALAQGNYLLAIQAFHAALQVNTQDPLAQEGLKQALAMEAEVEPVREQSSITTLAYQAPIPNLQPSVFSETERLNVGVLSNLQEEKQAFLILAQLQAGDHGAALKSSRALLKQNASSGAYNLLGLAQAQLGDSRQAKQAFESALRLDTHFHMARLNLAKILMTGGDFAEAEKQIQTVLSATQLRDREALKSMVLLKQLQGDTAGMQEWSLRLRAL